MSGNVIPLRVYEDSPYVRRRRVREAVARSAVRAKRQLTPEECRWLGHTNKFVNVLHTGHGEPIKA